MYSTVAVFILCYLFPICLGFTPCVDNIEFFNYYVVSAHEDCTPTDVDTISKDLDAGELARLGAELVSGIMPHGWVISFVLDMIDTIKGEESWEAALDEQYNELLGCMDKKINNYRSYDIQGDFLEIFNGYQTAFEGYDYGVEIDDQGLIADKKSDMDDAFDAMNSHIETTWEAPPTDYAKAESLLPIFDVSARLYWITVTSFLRIRQQLDSWAQYETDANIVQERLTWMVNWREAAISIIKNGYAPNMVCDNVRLQMWECAVQWNEKKDISEYCILSAARLEANDYETLAANAYTVFVNKIKDLTKFITTVGLEIPSSPPDPLSILEIEIYSRGKDQSVINGKSYPYVKVSGIGSGTSQTYTQKHRGFHIVVLRGDGNYVNKGTFDTYGDYYRGHEEASDAAVDLLEGVEPGQIVLITTWDSVDLDISDESQEVLNILESWGCAVTDLNYRDSFVYIGYAEQETVYCGKKKRNEKAIKLSPIKLIKTVEIEVELYSRGLNQAKINGIKNPYVKVGGFNWAGDINGLYAQSRGFQIVILDKNDGNYVNKGTFDTYGDYYRHNSAASDAAVALLDSVETGQIVLITTYDSVDLNGNTNVSGAVLNILKSWGCTVTDLNHRDSFIYIGYAKQGTVHCEKSTRYDSAIKETFKLII